MDMMHAQVVGVAPAAPTFLDAVRSGNGQNQQYLVTWTDNSKNETAFAIERRVEGSGGAWSPVATVPSDRLLVGPGTGAREYTDLLGNDKTLYEYQVIAINVVGDSWDYSNPALNEILPGSGWPTLTLDSRPADAPPPAGDTVAAPSDLAGSAVVKNKKNATVTLNWTDNSGNETGFLIQRAYDAGFTSGVANATLAGDLITFNETAARGTTFYYRVLAFNATTQSGWSNTTIVTTP
jgi:hypothetical protein